MATYKKTQLGKIVYCKECGWNMESYTNLFLTNNGVIRADWFHWCSYCGYQPNPTYQLE